MKSSPDGNENKEVCIMVTAEGQKDNVMEAAKVGVSNYVVKPFTPDTFSEKLQKVLG